MQHLNHFIVNLHSCAYLNKDRNTARVGGFAEYCKWQMQHNMWPIPTSHTKQLDYESSWVQVCACVMNRLWLQVFSLHCRHSRLFPARFVREQDWGKEKASGPPSPSKAFSLPQSYSRTNLVWNERECLQLRLLNLVFQHYSCPPNFRCV